MSSLPVAFGLLSAHFMPSDIVVSHRDALVGM
jgi:hypothetical protein